VAKNTFLLVVGDSATKIALFVLYAVIGRTLGTRGFGDYTLAISLAFFVSASALGIDVILSREIARDVTNQHGMFWESVVLKLSAGLPILALVTLFSVADGDSVTLILSVALIGLSNLIDVVAQSPHAVLRAVEDMGPPTRALLLESLVVVVLGSVALAILGGTLIALSVVYVIASAVGLLYIWVMLGRRGFRPRRHGTTRGIAWLGKAAIPTGITSVFGYALGRIDAVILSVLTNKPRIVGFYGGAYRIFEATLFLSWAMGLAVYPLLSRLPRRSEALERLFEVSCMATAAVTVPLGMLMALFGQTIVETTFGRSFADAGPATRILGIAAALYGVYTIAAMTLAAQDRQQTFPLISAAVLGVNVALNLILIPVLSLRGAAIAMTIAQLILTMLVLRLVFETTVSLSVTRIFGACAAGAAAMTLVALALGTGVLGLLASVLVYAIVFLAIEWRLHRADLLLFARAMRHRGGGIELGPDGDRTAAREARS